MKNWISILVSLCLWGNLHAQINNEVLSDKIEVQESDSGKFSFLLKTNTYFRNTEYFNEIELGRTLLGYQFQPGLAYQINSHVKLEAGVYVRRDFGSPEVFTELQPVFSLKAQKKGFSMIMGTLEGALSHGFHEPIFDINRYIERRNEEGLQFKFKDQQTFIDLFIDWNRYTNRNSNEQEKFVFGFHAKRNLLNKNSSYKIMPDVQVIGKHHGGQIGSNSDTVTMRWNRALGLRFEQGNETTKGFFDFNYLFYSEPDKTGIWPSSKGKAIFSNLGFKKNHITVSGTIFSGSDFLVPIGTPIYSSQSIEKASTYQTDRNLFFLRLIYEKALMKSDVMASIRFEPVYDLQADIFDYSYSVYLVYKINKNISKK
jgi:hypothetical protein